MADRKIYYLRDLDDYKVASDYNDVRGWPLLDQERCKVGEIDSLVVNKDSERVVYLDVDLDEDYIWNSDAALAKSASKGVHTFVNEDGEDHLIVPIGLVTVDSENQRVLCDTLSPDTFRKAKRHRKNSELTLQYELEVMNIYANADGRIVAIDDPFYSRPEFLNNRGADRQL
jgi:hypothetical protein